MIDMYLVPCTAARISVCKGTEYASDIVILFSALIFTTTQLFLAFFVVFQMMKQE